MSYSSLVIEQFRGFDFRDASDPQTSGARYCMNFRVDDLSRLRVRGGYQARGANLASANPPLGLALKSDGKVVMPTTASLRYFTPAGYTSTDLTSLTGYSGDVAEMFGVMYLPRLTGTLVSFNGTAVTAVASSPWGKFISPMPQEARLAVAYAGIGGLQATRVHFSTYDVGTATNSWGANDFVEVRPNDGGGITGLVTWQDNLYVFKPGAFFVFYGSSTKSDGSAQFNFRAVDVGVGCIADNCAVAGIDGVYFMARDGVYRTTGGPPVKVSDAIQAVFDGSAPPTLGASAPPVPSLTSRMYAAPEGIYIVDGDNNNTWVYSYATKEWGAYSSNNAVPYMMVANGGAGDHFFVDSSGLLYQSGYVYTADGAGNIIAEYSTNWSSLEYVSTVIREAEIAGIGELTGFFLLTDWLDVAGSATAVTLGTSPNVASARSRIAVRGESFSIYLQCGSTVPGTEVDRIILRTRDHRGQEESST